MFYRVILLFCLFCFFTLEVIFTLLFLRRKNRERINLKTNIEKLKKEEVIIKEKLSNIENNINEYFLFYELTKKLATILNKKDLFNIFYEEIKLLNFVKDVKFQEKEEVGYFSFPITDDKKDTLIIKIDRGHFDYIANTVLILKLCIERIKLYNKLQELSIVDSLTGIYNRRYFLKRYSEEFERANKFKLSLSLLMIDIDNFKRINDNFGHLVGDIVLKEVSKILKNNIRSIDFVGRFGGEEFVLILPETDKTNAIIAAERLSLAISSKPFRIFDDIIIDVRVSIGVGSYPENTLYEDVLIELVDKALYKAKSLGKNRVAWF